MTKASEWIWEIENAQEEDRSTAIREAYKHAERIDYDIDCDCCPWLYFSDGSVLRIDEEEGYFDEVN